MLVVITIAIVKLVLHTMFDMIKTQMHPKLSPLLNVILLLWHVEYVKLRDGNLIPSVATICLGIVAVATSANMSTSQSNLFLILKSFFFLDYKRVWSIVL